jgi:hypothetical protein
VSDVEKIARDNYRDGMSAGALARQVSGWLPKESIVRWMLEDMLGSANFDNHDRHMIFSDFDKIDEKESLAAKMRSFYRINGRKSAPAPVIA